MKAMSPALKQLLASRNFYAVELFVLTLVGGTVLRYSAGDCDLKDPAGNLYSCGGMVGPFWDRNGTDGTRATVHQKLGIDVDTLTIDVIPGASTVLGLPWLQAIRQGVLRGARFQRLTGYAQSVPLGNAWPLTLVGTLERFTGDVGNIDGGDTALTLTVLSSLARLQRPWPREAYQPSCQNTLGDIGCGVSLTARQVVGVVGANSTSGVIKAALPQASSYFDLGILTFTSGALTGQSRSVGHWAAGAPGLAGTIALMSPFPVVPVPGDSFTITPGCDGTTGVNGCPKFGDIAAFRGHPFVPAPSTAG